MLLDIFAIGVLTVLGLGSYIGFCWILPIKTFDINSKVVSVLIGHGLLVLILIISFSIGWAFRQLGGV